MKYILAFLLVAFFSFPAQAGPGTDRYSPMGDRTALFQKLPYNNAAKTVSFEYYFLGPRKIDPKAKYPLIVMLHGRSGHAYGAYALAEEILDREMPVFVVVPVMPERISSWTDELFEDQDEEMPKPIDHVAALTKRLAANLPIDSSRIYVTGYSMGGYGTFGAIYFYPDLFAAGVPICGGWDPRYAKHFINTPIWAFHGKSDNVIPYKHTTDIISGILQKGGNPKMTLYPGVRHNSWVNAYHEAEMWSWLLSQKKAPTQ